ncbi:MAG: 6-phosphogluconolactonase, partial [Oceanobacter sp.]
MGGKQLTASSPAAGVTSVINDFSFDSSAVLARQLAESVAKKLQQRIDLKGRACLAVSGGKTPVLFFDALSKQDIEWSKTVITLV